MKKTPNVSNPERLLGFLASIGGVYLGKYLGWFTVFYILVGFFACDHLLKKLKNNRLPPKHFKILVFILSLEFVFVLIYSFLGYTSGDHGELFDVLLITSGSALLWFKPGIFTAGILWAYELCLIISLFYIVTNTSIFTRSSDEYLAGFILGTILHLVILASLTKLIYDFKKYKNKNAIYLINESKKETT